jgi:murein DD-endopeptidase MepM/ murein hydrolase activator NlpD
MIMGFFITILFISGRAYANSGVQEATYDWIFPTEGTISDVFHARQHTHKGIDIAGALGTPIYAVDEGTVIKSYYSESYGHVIFLRHHNGLETVYAHLDTRNVDENEQVAQGQMIGEMGDTGNSTGVHLHFEIHNGEWTIDKIHAIDPFLVFGHGNIGDVVYALNHDPYWTIPATAVAYEQEEEEEQVHADDLVNEELDDITEEQFEDVIYQQENAKQPESDGGAEENAASDNTEQETDMNKTDVMLYDVAEGDTLWSIAAQHETSIELIKEANHLESDTIHQKQRLIIPSKNEHKYIVKQGDTLTKIAEHYQVSIDDLKEWNELDDDIILSEDTLMIKGE